MEKVLAYLRNPESVVYYKRLKSGIVITRNVAGIWKANYFVPSLVKYSNKKLNTKYRTSSGQDMFDLGWDIGVHIQSIINKCRVSYGDPIVRN